MKNKINIAELLKGCPKGMELDCTMYDNIVFDYIDEKSIYPIKCRAKITDVGSNSHEFTKNGQPNHYSNAKCVIFPKGKTTWEGFVPPIEFKDGDILFVDCSDEEDKSYQYIFILNKSKYCGKWHSYCHLNGVNYFHSAETYLLIDDEYHPRFATEEEKQKLFDAIKANGYKWNEETKTLEKLIKPLFKVGDRIKEGKKIATVVRVCKDVYDIRLDSGGIGAFTIDLQDKWELIPNKFGINTLKPFDKVLVRDLDKTYWCINFFGFYNEITEQFHCLGNTEIGWNECIPYEENKHLLSTTNDCDDFYKTWEK